MKRAASAAAFRGRPRHYDGIVAAKAAEVVALRRRLRERCRRRRVAMRPRNRPGEAAGRALQRRRQAGPLEPLGRKLRIVVEDQVVN